MWFFRNAKMIPWSLNGHQPGDVLSMGAVEINPDVTEEQKKYKVAMRLYRVGCDTGIIHWSGGPFVSPGYVFINYNSTRNIFPYGTTADRFDTVGDFLEYQKENVKIYHNLVEDGIINENMFILPINGYLFTEAIMEIMVYENEEDERDNIEYGSFQLNAVFCPLTKN